VPLNYETEPLMHHPVADSFCGPTDSMLLPIESLDLAYEAEVAMVVDAVTMGTAAADASPHITEEAWLAAQARCHRSRPGRR
jgi:2-keto-4-pentenoate hydratase/2-oxohepta-3-ene-1,7-dioic acid hydratase in catechol pathway